MKIDIGNNNKIENSNIGENNRTESSKSQQDNSFNNFCKIVIEIIIGIIVAVISGYILYKLNWN